MNEQQAQDQADRVIARGYRKISNNHQMVARIDRPDWREHMASCHSPWSFAEGMKWVQCLDNSNPGSAEDYYRRCHSQDRKTISAQVFRHIPSSGHDSVGYIPLDHRQRPIMSKQLENSEQALGMYKIHSINVLTGRSHSTANSFHDDLDSALSKAKSIVKRDPNVEMVVLKCTHVVRHSAPPVEVLTLDE